MSHTSPEPIKLPVDADHVDFAAAQRGEDFVKLRKTHRSFVMPMTVAFLVWYLAYVVLAVYAPGLMGIQVVGNINLGIILGLLQFVTTFGITALYVSFANRKLDPLALKLRTDIEDGQYAHGKTN